MTLESETGPAVIVEDGRLKLAEVTTAIESPTDILVKVEFAAQNPVDVKMLDSGKISDRAVAGMDFYGVVYEIGDEVADRELVGKRIAAVANTGKKQGCFSEWAIATDGVYFDIPSRIRGDQAATLGVGFLTAVDGLFMKTKLGLKGVDSQDGEVLVKEVEETEETKEDKSSDSSSKKGACKTDKQIVLIWGGNSSVGRYAIQLAALAGYEPVTTSSMSAAKELRKLGAARTYFYEENDVVEQIIDENGEIEYIFDAIGSESSAELCAKAAGSIASKYTTVRPNSEHTASFPANITVSPLQAYKVFNSEFEEASIGKEYAKKLGTWLLEGRIEPNHSLIVGGLDKVVDGYELHRDGFIRGQKLVYEVSRTRKSQIGKFLQ